ncbi:MAG: EamA family transporter [Burkholderiales bacterium]|nr:EamA family transporter [Anaerolineae bacterium]
MGKWAAFWLVGIIWGSSFLLIRVGVEAFHPLQLVFIRVGIAAVGLSLVAIIQRKAFPKDWKTIRALIIIGIGNTVVPFLLITIGEQTVESGIASVLQATAALFTLVIAHFAFQDERMTPQRIGGIVTGFIGVIILATRGSGEAQAAGGSYVWGQIAIVAASLFYAMFSVYSRKVLKTKVEPVVVAAIAMLTSAITTGVMVFAMQFFGGPPPALPATLNSDTLIAVLVLGLVNTFIAYLFFYYIIRELGSARASMVTYVVSPVGLTLGVIFLDEALDAKLVIGAALIFAGIGIVNLRSFRRPKPTFTVPQQV